MKVTIKDVAQKAGVSFKTVSRVINQEGSVKQDTREKVNQAIAELNYQPNNAARSLAGTRAYALGFIYSNPNAYYVIDMQRGILDECHARGYELLIHPCEPDTSNLLAEMTDLVRRSQLSGLVICPPLSENSELMKQLSQLDIPFVRVVSGSDEAERKSPCVFIHDCEAAQEITQHLIDCGHQKIAFISGEKDHNSTLERLKGYRKAMHQAGLEIDSHWEVNGRYAFDSGVEGAQTLLALDNPPSAIFACNDEIAAGALFAARLMGVQVPQQLAIAGFEDSPFSRQTLPKLTTAAQPTRNIAREAANMLLDNVAMQRAHKPINKDLHRHYQPQLVLRDSTQSK